MMSFTFFLKDKKFDIIKGVVENFDFSGLSGICSYTINGLLIESYMGDCSKVSGTILKGVLDSVVKAVYYRVHANYYTVRQEVDGFTVLLGRLVKRRFPLMKQYKINNTWGIRCYTRNYDNAMCIEVFMLQVPWEEVVDDFVSHNKDEANAKFKEFVAKYKNLEAFK